MKTITIELTEYDLENLKDVVYKGAAIDWLFPIDGADEYLEKIKISFIPEEEEE